MINDSVDEAAEPRTLMAVTESQTRFVQGSLALLGACAFATVLAFHNITDGDLWAKLAIGETLWNTGHIPRHDVYAFTPDLPEYIDHEWGAGVVFYAMLQWFGPAGLMLLRNRAGAGLARPGVLDGPPTGLRRECVVAGVHSRRRVHSDGLHSGRARSHVFTFFLFAANACSRWRNSGAGGAGPPPLCRSAAGLDQSSRRFRGGLGRHFSLLRRRLRLAEECPLMIFIAAACGP